MTQEALKLAIQLRDTASGYWTENEISIIAKLIEALAQPEQEPLEYWNAVEGWVKIDEVREHLNSVGCGTIYKTAGDGRVPLCLAQPEQEPVAWLLTDKNINSLQVDSIQRLIDRLKHAHHTDLCVRINGQDEWFQADWLKHMVRATPPQRTEPVIDKSAAIRIATTLGWTPPRPWVGLTDEEIDNINYTSAYMLAREVEGKLKERNQ